MLVLVILVVQFRENLVVLVEEQQETEEVQVQETHHQLHPLKVVMLEMDQILLVVMEEVELWP